MNQNRILLGLGLAVLLALFLSTYVYRQFKQVANNKPAPTGKVVVAATAMQLGTRVDVRNLKLISWPSDEPVKGMFTRIEDCANRALIAPVAANELILDSKLAAKESGAGLAAAIPEGMRAISVAVNDVVAVAGFVTPGTMVDVMVREGKPQTVPVITLLVSPEDAAKLAMASTEGKIQLALRNTVDTKRVEPAAVMEAALFSGVAPAQPVKHIAAKPAPSAPAPYTIEVITGNKRENKSFPQ
jgi:pilus assembly protein CpaB